jgi:NADP-dependent 3-hydroxy acid dehydrogenase YdfG
MESIRGQVAVITGASRGIGRASAIALAREGCAIVVSARDAAQLDEVVAACEAHGVRAVAVAADLATEAGVRALHAAVMATFGQADILVNNAGVARYAPLQELTIEDYDWMMNTNMRSTFLVTHAFLEGMLARGSGAIITVSSVAGLDGFPNETVYCATKFAQIGFMQGLDHEVRERGLKVSVIAPGGVNTTFAFGGGRYEGQPELQQMLEPEDVADAVVFAARQPLKSRVLLIKMRPMFEAQ